MSNDFTSMSSHISMTDSMESGMESSSVCPIPCDSNTSQASSTRRWPRRWVVADNQDVHGASFHDLYRSRYDCG